MISSRCPYCGKYNKSKFYINKDHDRREAICENCKGKYKLNISLLVSETSFDEELLKVLPNDKIETIKKVITKYLGYKGKGGYENSRDIVLDKLFTERLNVGDNCYSITFGGKATYCGTDDRTVTFKIYFDKVVPSVKSEFTWKQGRWWNGAYTLEEQVERYINFALVKWETI